LTVMLIRFASSSYLPVGLWPSLVLGLFFGKTGQLLMLLEQAKPALARNLGPQLA